MKIQEKKEKPNILDLKKQKSEMLIPNEHYSDSMEAEESPMTKAKSRTHVIMTKHLINKMKMKKFTGKIVKKLTFK